MENAIQKAQAGKVAAGKPVTIQDYIKRMEGEIKKALPSTINPERFTRIILSAVSTNPKLSQCTPASFLGAMMTAAQLGLEVNTPLGQAYLIPYRNRGQLECQFQMGYKGMIALAYNSDKVSTISAETVYKNDTFEYELGLEQKLRHVPAKGDRGDPVCFYGLFRTKSGGYGFKVMSAEEVRAHAKRYSKAYNSGPWQANFEEMAKKTVLRQALKYAPMSTELARAISADGTIKTTLSDDMFDLPDETVIEVEGYEVDESTGEVVGGGEESS